MMTPKFLVDFLGKISEDPKLMLMLCYGRFDWEDQNFCHNFFKLKFKGKTKLFLYLQMN